MNLKICLLLVATLLSQVFTMDTPDDARAVSVESKPYFIDEALDQVIFGFQCGVWMRNDVAINVYNVYAAIDRLNDGLNKGDLFACDVSEILEQNPGKAFPTNIVELIQSQGVSLPKPDAISPLQPNYMAEFLELAKPSLITLQSVLNNPIQAKQMLIVGLYEGNSKDVKLMAAFNKASQISQNQQEWNTQQGFKGPISESESASEIIIDPDLLSYLEHCQKTGVLDKALFPSDAIMILDNRLLEGTLYVTDDPVLLQDNSYVPNKFAMMIRALADSYYGPGLSQFKKEDANAGRD